ncbi:MAG: polysaccharide pyruvyl transferase family protein, partial [Clostridiales bacterium]|nr:polysaccharide pyruvyl transferase family protein [Clostridiales bacterium]
MEGTKKLNILLITNRDSDNCGDQVIEACDIALLSVIMRQIGFSETDFKISSRALAIVSNEFVAAQNEKLLEGAREAIKSADCVIFGGAPVFNYKYQSFYFKTSTIINLAKQYAKPIIFSAIGIDGYDDNSNKCQMIKDALRAGTVKQITTRDGITFLRKYTNEIDIPIHLVADPAVFAVSVYSDVVN